MNFKAITYFFVFSLVLVGCAKDGVNEGVIKYDITFNEEEKKTNNVIGLLPTEMEQMFKNGNSKCRIEGFMGMFLTALISNTESKSNSYVFSINTQYYMNLFTNFLILQFTFNFLIHNTICNISSFCLHRNLFLTSPDLNEYICENF